MLKPMLAAAAAASLFALGACGQTTTVDADDSAAQDVENAADRAADNIENAADNAGDSMEAAGDRAEDAVNDATDGNPNTNP